MNIPELPLAWLPLADAVAKTTVILLAATAASILLRPASAALRHLVWTLALSSALVLPIASVALPKWQLPLFTVEADLPPEGGSHAGVVSADPVDVASTDPASVASVDPASVASAFRRKDADGVRIPRNTGSPVDSVPASASAVPSLSWQQMLLGIWMLGAAAILGRVLVGLIALRWLSRRTLEITDAAWLPMARAIARDMGVSRRLRFLRSGRASMPVAAGIFRPAVIMPADADGWSESRLRVVLLHELAHVKRRDCLTHVLGQAACAFHWFNPLAWLALKRARTERERACDDLVLACGTRGSDYADQLLEMARVLRGDRFPALLGGASLAMAHRSQLEGRLIAILDPRVPRAGLTRGRALAAVTLCCAAVAPLGALQPWTSRPPAAAILDQQPASADLALPPPVASPDQRVRRDRADIPRPVTGLQGESASPTKAERTQVEAIESDRDHHAANPHVVATPQPMPMPMPTPMPTPHAAVNEGIAIGQAVGQTVVNTWTNVVFDDVPRLAWAHDAKPAGEKPAGDKAGGRADARMVAALTAALKDPDKEVRETAMSALVQLRDPSVFEPLVQALKDASPDVREQAAFGLGQMRDRRAVQPLIGALKDENPDVREKAAFALGQLHDPAAVDGLGGAIKDSDADVREQAVFALGQIRDRRAVQPLIGALRDSSPDVREKAAFALGQLGDRAAVDALMAAVKDANKDVREHVIFALGQLRDPRAIDALMTALKDQDAEVRRQAAFALGQLAR